MVHSGGSRSRERAREGGFSLIAIATMSVVMGLMLDAFIYTYKQVQMQDRQANLNYSMLQLANSMENYLSKNSQYPCPAAIQGVTSNNTAYGAATDCTDQSVAIGTCGAPGTAKAYCVTENPPGSGIRIRIGALPFRDLNIDKEDILDVYKNQYTYAVTETQAVATSAANPAGTFNVNLPGAIHVHDTDPVHNVCYTPGVNNCIAGHAVDAVKNFILIGGGSGHMGVYSPDGTLSGIACAGAGSDVQNCLWTTSPSSMLGTFNSAPHSTQAGATHFDDTIMTDTDLWQWIYVWDQTNADPNSIYNRLPANMGIGTNAPRQKLEVQGNLRVESALVATPPLGNTQNTRVCTDTAAGGGTNCFPPGLLGGNPSTGGGMACPANYIVGGIANSAPGCVFAFGNVNGGCTGTTFVTGFNYTYAGGFALTVTCTDISGAPAGTASLH